MGCTNKHLTIKRSTWTLAFTVLFAVLLVGCATEGKSKSERKSKSDSGPYVIEMGDPVGDIPDGPGLFSGKKGEFMIVDRERGKEEEEEEEEKKDKDKDKSEPAATQASKSAEPLDEEEFQRRSRIREEQSKKFDEQLKEMERQRKELERLKEEIKSVLDSDKKK